ncbi:MAG: tRNA (guanosine(46)-N7)-methyltransferase TrmB [Gammaproteobacteria bacterium]|nr:tRNA (guanosine(46)-N7)-methyltransferase TrmB [Gammaproteobacteria bacterium]
MTEKPPAIRSIKSFVRRSGRLTPGQKSALDLHWPIYGLDFSQQLLELDKLSSGFQAIKLEIGIGNGDALINMATHDTQSLYLGIEVHQPGIGRCLTSIHDKQVSNIRLIAHDAIEVMQHMLPALSLDRILLFFPDPWHKKRHHKRRIVNQQFRDLGYGLLKPGGYLHCATDWQDYAGHMATELFSDKRFENQGDGNGFCICPDYRPMTHFEKRGRNLGHGVWDLVFQKIRCGNRISR